MGVTFLARWKFKISEDTRALFVSAGDIYQLAENWSRSACFVSSLINGYALMHNVSLQVSQDPLNGAHAISCYRRKTIWVHEKNACSLTTGFGYEFAAQRCEYLASPYNKIEIEDDHSRVTWKPETAEILRFGFTCLGASTGTCVPDSEGETVRAPVLPLDIGPWQARNGSSLLILQKHATSLCVASHVFLPQSAPQFCGGCNFSNPSIGGLEISPEEQILSFPCLQSAPIFVRLREQRSALGWEAEISSHAERDQASLAFFMVPLGPAIPATESSWICHVNETLSWHVLSAPSLKEALEISDYRPVMEPNQTGRVRRFPQERQGKREIVAAIAPGLWAPQSDARIILQTNIQMMWLLLPATGARPCDLVRSGEVEVFRMQPAPWALPLGRPTSCPNGGVVATNVSIRNQGSSFFYRPVQCATSVARPRYAPCHCPWRWSPPNATVFVDGAALLYECAIVVDSKTNQTQWHVNGEFLHCDIANVSNSSRSLPSECVAPVACSTSNGRASACGAEIDAVGCRKCKASLSFLTGDRCFEHEALQFATRAAQGSAKSFHSSSSRQLTPPAAPGRRQDVCLTREERQSQDLEVERLGARFLPAVRAQLRARLVFQGMPDAIIRVVGDFVGAPWTPHRNAPHWLAGFGQMRSNVPFRGSALRDAGESLTRAWHRTVEQRILSGLPRPIWRGPSDSCPEMWDSNDLEFCISRPIDGRLHVEGWLSTRNLYTIRAVQSRRTTEGSWEQRDQEAFYSPSVEEYLSLSQVGRHLMRASWSRLSDGSIFISLAHRDNAVTHLRFYCDETGSLRLERERRWTTRPEVMANVRDPHLALTPDHWRQTLIEPTSGPIGQVLSGRAREGTLVMSAGFAYWVLRNEPQTTLLAPVAFISNLFYMTSEVTDLQAPPYLFDWKRSRLGRKLGPSAVDWRAYYTLVPQTSLWRKTGTLVVVFRLRCHDPAYQYNYLLKDRDAYFIAEFLREREDADPERVRREQTTFQSLRVLNEFGRLFYAPAKPPTSAERQSPDWMRAIGWRFVLGCRHCATTLLQEIQGLGCIMWQTPASIIDWPGEPPDAVGLLSVDSVRVSSSSAAHWIALPLPSSTQEYFRAREPTLLPDFFLTSGQHFVDIATIPTADAQVFRLAILSQILVDRGVDNNPLLNYATLRVKAGNAEIRSESSLTVLPFPSFEGENAFSFELMVHQMGYPWRQSLSALSLLHPWRKFAPVLDVLSTMEKLAGNRRNVFIDNVYAQSGFIFSSRNVWTMAEWRAQHFVRTGYLPSPDGRLEFRVRPDCITRGTRHGYIQVQVRRPVLRLRDNGPVKLLQPIETKIQPNVVVASYQNSLEIAHEDECFLCQQTLGMGRPCCIICQDIRNGDFSRNRRRFIPRKYSKQHRRILTPLARVLADENTGIEFEDLGDISFKLAL